MRPSPLQIHYELRLITTTSGAGFFGCRPEKVMPFDGMLSYLRTHPNDEFMRKELLLKIAGLDKKPFRKKLESARQNDPLLHSLLCEATLLYEKFFGLQALFPYATRAELARQSPLIYIRSSCQPDQQNHFEWTKRFRDNIFAHRQLPSPDHIGLNPLFEDGGATAGEDEQVAIRQLTSGITATRPGKAGGARFSPEETAQKALERLETIHIFTDIEKRHVASLSPIGLLRRWQMHIRVRDNRHHYTLKGIQTSYGKGLSLDAARASCTMEIVERCSSFAGVENGQMTGYRQHYPLRHATFGELVKDGLTALDPNHLQLEAPYDDAPLYWIEGLGADGRRNQTPIWVPAQCVFLFCNLDEIKLFSALGSTGLASGNTPAEAKMSALLEIIERDAENTTPFHPARCFQMTTRDPALSALLEQYRTAGIHVQFQDLTPPMGVPCCKCFVVGMDGQVHKGTGAHLNARSALISALTETPYPFPYGPPSRPPHARTTIVPFEALPDYSTGDIETDLTLLEQLLCANGFQPIYVNLTRKDLDIPVVKAIIPGMELISDFDRFSRVNPRLYRNYLRLFA